MRLRRIAHPVLSPPVPGEALGVVTLPEPGAAALVIVRVHRMDPERDPVPEPPAGLRSDAVEGLYSGAAQALLLYNRYDVRDPRRAFRFQVTQLDGSPLTYPQPLEGGSLGLTALVATCSLLAMEPVHGGLVFTGAVSMPSEGEALKGVQGLAIKAREVHAAGARFVVPGASAGELPNLATGVVPVDSTREALVIALGADWDSPERCASQLQPARTVEGQLEGDYSRCEGGWESLAERFERFASRPDLSPRMRGKALARAGACWTHLNDATRAQALLDRAHQLLEMERSRLRQEDALIIINHLAVLYRDAYQFDEALHLLGKALRGVDSNTDEAVNARSTLGQILVCTGRWDEGLPHVMAAREHHDAEQSTDCPRSHCYVLEAYARAGRLEEARREYELGTRHNRERNSNAPQVRRRNQAFLDYALWNGELRAARGMRGPGPWARLAAVTEQLPSLPGEAWPGPALDRVRSAIRLRTLRSSEEREALRQRALQQAQTPFPLLNWHWGLVSVEAALSELERGGEPELARRWLAEGLQKMPRLGAAQRFFAPGLERVRHALEPEQLLSAIKLLLDTEQY